MTYTYKLDAYGESIIRIEDRAFIPMTTENRDYVEYLAWLEEGNTPEAADPEPEVS